MRTPTARAPAAIRKAFSRPTRSTCFQRRASSSFTSRRSFRPSVPAFSRASSILSATSVDGVLRLLADAPRRFRGWNRRSCPRRPGAWVTSAGRPRRAGLILAEAAAAPRGPIEFPSLDPRTFLRALYRAAVSAVEPGRLVAEALSRRGNAVVVRSVSDPGRREFVFVPAPASSSCRSERPPSPWRPRPTGPSATARRRVARRRPGRVSRGGAARPAAATSPRRHPRARRAEPRRRARGARARLGPPRGGPPRRPPLRRRLEPDGAPRRGDHARGQGADGLAPLGRRGADRRHQPRAGRPLARQGRAARAAARAADVVTLVLSDLGDDGWHLVASGPTLGVPPSPAGRRDGPRDLAAPLARPRLRPRLPPRRRTPRTAPQDGGQRWSVLLGDIRTALEGARHEALRLGADVRVLPDLLVGEARSAARRLAVAGACAGNLVRRLGRRASGAS